jgi:peptidylprolyl isomerase
MKKIVALTLAMVLIGSVSGQSQTVAPKADSASAKQKTEKAVEPPILSKPSGVRYQDLVVGKGVEAALGSPVQCHYTLWLADSTGLKKGQMIQSSKTNNQPLTCTLGQGLINGWSDGMVGMKEGGTRRLYIPWQQAYGAQGGRGIPGKANLIFEIEYLKAVK